MSSLVESVRDGRVLHLTLNRPAKRNALDAALCRDLADALEAAAQDPAVGAILLDAAGKSFCAGMDLAEITAPANPAEIDDLHERLFTIGARIATPIIAAVHGAALAGGTGLVANAHIAVAAPDATFGLTEVRIGLWPFLVYRAVVAAIGDRRTLELALTGRIVPAAEARDLGLIHEIAADTPARAAEIAHQIASYSPVAIKRGIGFVHQSRRLAPSEAGALGRQIRNEVFASPGFREGIRAFLESRSVPQPQAPSRFGEPSPQPREQP
jgi:enoyl-CoA hydratase/carnithine racemase